MIRLDGIKGVEASYEYSNKEGIVSSELVGRMNREESFLTL